MSKYVIDNLKLIIPKESMEKLYLEEKLTIKQIADKYNAKPTSINSLIDEYGIVKRTKGSGGIRNCLEKRLTETDLIHFYHDLDMTLIDIADIYKVSVQTVANLMTKPDHVSDFI